MDYGYFEGTVSTDGEGIDVFVGTSERKRADAIFCTVDLFKKDVEILVVFGRMEEEKNIVYDFVNRYDTYKGIMIKRD